MSRNGKRQAYQSKASSSRMNLYPNEEDIIEADYEELVDKPSQASRNHRANSAPPLSDDKGTFAKLMLILSVFAGNIAEQIRRVDWPKHLGQVAQGMGFVLKKSLASLFSFMSLIHDSIAPQYRSVVYIITALIIMLTPLAFVMILPDADIAAPNNGSYDLPISQQGSSQSNSPLATFFSPTVHYWSDDIVRWSETTGFDANFLATIIQLESCGNPRLLRGDRLGLFAVPQSEFAANEAFDNSETNASRAIARLERGLNLSNGDLDMALAYFHGGEIVLQSDFTTWSQNMRDIFIFGRRMYRDAQSGLVESDAFNQWMAATGAGLCQEASMTLNI